MAAAPMSSSNSGAPDLQVDPAEHHADQFADTDVSPADPLLGQRSPV